MLQVINYQDALVVDSRLIAAELGIEHRSFFKTVKNYQIQIQQSFGVLRFEISKLGMGRPQEFCYLTENQATFLMTLSKNTPQVIACKTKLVEAFDRAKKVIVEQSEEIQVLKLKLELTKLEKERDAVQLAILNKREWISTALPEPLQQKILGFEVVERVEYRDRVIVEDRVIDDGDTLNKTELCRRYGFTTRNGKPDYKRLNDFLDRSGIARNSEAWKLAASIQEHQQFRREFLPLLDQLMNESNRQLWLGE